MTTLASGENATIAMIRRCAVRQQGAADYNAGTTQANAAPDSGEVVPVEPMGVEGAVALPWEEYQAWA